MKYFGNLFCLIATLAMAGCGHPTMEAVFNTSTEAYPVATDASASSALDGLAGVGEGALLTSTVKIAMKEVASSKMKAVWLEALVLIAKEGDLGFIQSAKCYVQGRYKGAKPILVGQAKASGLATDQKSLRFEPTDPRPEVSGVLRSPLYILIEIQGDRPKSNVSVSAELTLKTNVEI